MTQVPATGSLFSASASALAISSALTGLRAGGRPCLAFGVVSARKWEDSL